MVQFTREADVEGRWSRADGKEESEASRTGRSVWLGRAGEGRMGAECTGMGVKKGFTLESFKRKKTLR